MGGRHRTGKGSRRAGWFVAGACVAAVALGASLTAVFANREPPAAGSSTDPEAGVRLRTYPVPQPTASPSDVARNLHEVDTAPPVDHTSRAAAAPTPQPSVTEPGRRRHGRPKPTRVCYTFRYHDHTYRFCKNQRHHPPHR